LGDEVEVKGFVENSVKAICFHVTNLVKISTNSDLLDIRQKGKDLQDNLAIGALGQQYK
jgi:hypothetical protein